MYTDKSSSFREHLERDDSVIIHESTINKNIQSEAAPELMTEIFKFKDHSYDLSKNDCLEKRIIKSYKYGKSCESRGKTMGCQTRKYYKS